MSKALRLTKAEFEAACHRIRLANERIDPKKPPATGKIRALAAPKPSRTGVGSQKAKKTRQEPKIQGAAYWTIYGEPASKANSRRLGRDREGVSRLFKSSKAQKYVEAFRRQAVPLPELFEGPVRVDITIWYASMRPDLDPSLILDLLQGVAYKNDRQVVEMLIKRGEGKDTPRAYIVVSPAQVRSGQAVEWVKRALT